MNLLNKVTALLLTALVAAAPVFAQSPANGPNPGKYGLTAWAVNGQRVASQFNYYIDSSFQSGVGGSYTFPISQITQALAFGGNRNVNPFNANASINIIDISSSLTEVVTPAATPVTYAGSTATIVMSPVNAHTSYVLRSGTCGLREALNDLGGQGGEVIVDQKFYDDGCTAATITTASKLGGVTALQNNQFVHDISNGQDTWYTLQPSNNGTALAVPTASATLVCATTAGLVCQSATTGGTWPNSAEHVGDIYVDALGNWSVASVDHSLTPSASGTNVLQFNSPAASAGAVGWLPYGGLTYNSATYVIPVTSTTCTLSTQYTGYPVCAIGANATVTALPATTGSLIPQSGGIAAAYNPNPQSHTAYTYAPSQRPGYTGFQLNYGPFVATPALTAGQLGVVGTVQLPPAFLNRIGQTIRFSFDVTNTPSTGGTATGIDVEIGDVTDFTTGTPKIVCIGNGDITTSGTAAIIYHEECDMTVTATGTTGAITPGGFGIEQVSAQGTIGNAYGIPPTSVTADLLDQNSIYFVYLQTSGAETTTPPQMQDLKIEVLNN